VRRKRNKKVTYVVCINEGKDTLNKYPTSFWFSCGFVLPKPMKEVHCLQLGIV